MKKDGDSVVEIFGYFFKTNIFFGFFSYFGEF